MVGVAQGVSVSILHPPEADLLSSKRQEPGTWWMPDAELLCYMSCRSLSRPLVGGSIFRAPVGFLKNPVYEVCQV